ncbi:hypothetical protein GBN24_03865 [Plesiomonas shigelloides]|uniref:VPA1262 family protein n=1 Tax=Plesiomonas shigelloides TaxID=703 RepID=UPI0012619779|nr:VPA1262 family protein [Plesiomonas shigelloides]KAB7693757.1 hypothetical protein GBN24_03865 [Plesiomonas shigelloides]
MTLSLNDVLNDERLARLFAVKQKHCALQLWVLQVQIDSIVENRVLYGRLLPYTYSNNSWSFSDSGKHKKFESIKIKITRLNLYFDSSLCRDLVSMICARESIDRINEALGLHANDKFKSLFGNTIVINGDYMCRPVSYLLNRDSLLTNTLVSPCGDAAALSASISMRNKCSLFMFDGRYNTEITTEIVNALNYDTGMRFYNSDISRIGELEFLVFPTLDDNEKNLLNIDRIDGENIKISFINTKAPSIKKFQVQLNVENNDQLLYSRVSMANDIGDGKFECLFKLGGYLSSIVDSVKVDVFSFKNEDDIEGELFCSWKNYYIREVSLGMNLVSGRKRVAKFDWLEKTTTPKMADRVINALSLSSDNLQSNSTVGGREVDAWVSENKVLESLFSKLYPLKSDGRFFPKWGESHGEGRLQFVEWFKNFVEKHKNRHIAIFDPYFEDVGLSLLTMYALPDTEYSIFRSIPKSTSKGNDPVITGLDNLIANCEHNRALLQNKNVKIYGIKDGLHDRYILVIDDNGLPVDGVHVSNSFQKATENFPLLITPIPTDVLYKTNQYAYDLIKCAREKSVDGEGQSFVSIIFDSKLPSNNNSRYEFLSVLENDSAGEVLSVWLNEPLLDGLCGEALKDKMAALDFLRGTSLHGLSGSGFIKCLHEISGKQSDFTSSWEIIGELLAHSPCGDSYIEGLQHERKFISFLEHYLSSSIERLWQGDKTECLIIDPKYLNMTLDELLHSPLKLYQLAVVIKYNAITWSEFYAIKYLWDLSPQSIISLMENALVELSTCNQITDDYLSVNYVKLSILWQAIGEISSNIELDVFSEEQFIALMKSNVDFINWIGWACVEKKLQASMNSESDEKYLSIFDGDKNIRFVGWAINRSSNNERVKEFYRWLVEKLFSLLPEKINQDCFDLLIHSLKGHMRTIGWCEPWLFDDVVFPLITSQRVDFDIVCAAWFDEIINSLNNEGSHHSLFFSDKQGGRVTNVCAYLFANSSEHFKNRCLQELKDIIKKQKRIIQRPLARTSNYSEWDEALKISLWILIFAKFCQYYLNAQNMASNYELNVLLRDADELAMVRTLSEWEMYGDFYSYLNEINTRLHNESNITE